MFVTPKGPELAASSPLLGALGFRCLNSSLLLCEPFVRSQERIPSITRELQQGLDDHERLRVRADRSAVHQQSCCHLHQGDQRAVAWIGNRSSTAASRAWFALISA
jgi:hypothetical protein